jgi:hypothetical protein
VNAARSAAMLETIKKGPLSTTEAIRGLVSDALIPGAANYRRPSPSNATD